MSSYGPRYDPDSEAQANSLSEVVFLSNRDVSAQIPLNFVTHPGVSITAACFATHGVYDPDHASRCLSDLLSARFGRFILDLYWDPGIRAYNLCPVQLPIASHTRAPALRAADTTVLSSFFTNSSGVGPTLFNISRTATPSSNTLPPTTTISGSSETIYQLGRYQCASTLNFSWILSLLSSYIAQTEESYRNNILFLEINLRAASPYDNPTGPAPTPPRNELPLQPQYLSEVITNNLKDLVYDPKTLQTDRSNLNLSWFGKNVPSDRYPITNYFGLETLPNGDLSTPDGWPNVNYLLISNLQRLLVTWGHIEPQMQGYNIQADAGTIFPSGTLSKPQVVDSNDTGVITSGCFYHDDTTRLADVNSSWATVVQTRDFAALTNNISACGIAPVLNASLAASDTIENFTPYERFAGAAVWNWAPGEPRNSSASNQSASGTDQTFRCALLDPTSAYKGHWRVEHCQKKYPVACRVDNQPYVWKVTSEHVAFETGPQVCSSNATFDVPRTALENTYLYHKVMADSPMVSGRAEGVRGVWIDFNSLNVQSCWVRGPNTTCPYYENPNAQRQREILVPTIGSIIVLLLTGLTIFVKCNNNRRNSRRVRKDGPVWYDGIPA